MVAHPRTECIRIELLGGFRVIVDGQAVDEGAWTGRRSRELVQLLVLSDGRRVLREHAIESLWPHLGPQAAAANLRKAAHYARQALGTPDAVVLSGGWVSLFPSHRVETDVEAFERAAASALDAGDPAACAAAASAYGGDLLPGSLYEEWSQVPRRELRARYVRLLRRSAQWERLVELEPTDEPAYQELMREALASGSRHAAIRWYGRLRTTLARELGLLPSSDTEALYEACLEGLAVEQAAVRGAPGRAGRSRRRGCARSADGAPGALAVRGPAGIGKSALCREIAAVARSEGWIAITVTAAKGAAPYTPLAAAVEELVRRDRARVEAVRGQPRAVLAELSPLAGPAPPLDGRADPPQGDRRVPAPVLGRRRCGRSPAGGRRCPPRGRGDHRGVDAPGRWQRVPVPHRARVSSRAGSDGLDPRRGAAQARAAVSSRSTSGRSIATTPLRWSRWARRHRLMRARSRRSPRSPRATRSTSSSWPGTSTRGDR